MFGRIKYTPDKYYRMGFLDMIAAIEGFGDEQMIEANRFRHLLLAPAWAMGSKESVRHLMPLSIDGENDKPVSKDEFLALAKKMAALDKKKIAKA